MTGVQTVSAAAMAEQMALPRGERRQAGWRAVGGSTLTVSTAVLAGGARLGASFLADEGLRASKGAAGARAEAIAADRSA